MKACLQDGIRLKAAGAGRVEAGAESFNLEMIDHSGYEAVSNLGLYFHGEVDSREYLLPVCRTCRMPAPNTVAIGAQPSKLL